jgi:uncharacterized membrane protein YuzA (DUF378 family)
MKQEHKEEYTLKQRLFIYAVSIAISIAIVKLICGKIGLEYRLAPALVGIISVYCMYELFQHIKRRLNREEN